MKHRTVKWKQLLKPALAAAVISLAAAALGAPGVLRTNIVLGWTMQAGSPLVDSFNLYASTNVTVPLTNWTLFTNIPSGYSSTTTNGAQLTFTNDTSFQASIPVSSTLGPMFFTLTATNIIGESPFSNVAGEAGAPAAGMLGFK